MESGQKSIFDDPALAIMGLVPHRYAAAGGAAESTVSAANWRAAWGAFAIGFAVIIALFWPTARQIVNVWYSSASYNHGFLILPICGYLIWLKRGRIASEIPRSSSWGIGVILMAGVAWLLGYAGSVSMVQQFALVFMLQGLVLAIFGTAVARVLIFPLAYMFFLVPFGQFLIPPLQDVTAVFVVKGLQMSGIPVFLDGVFLSIPTGNFEVAEACAGVRFLIATVALGTLFAHITYRSYRRQAVFVLLSFVVPIVANGFRAFGIVMLAYVSNNEIAVGVDHIIYGWIFFSIITAVLLLLGMTFRDSGMIEVVPDVAAVRKMGAGAAAQRRFGIFAIAVILTSAIAPAYAYRISAEVMREAPGVLPAPTVGGGWQPTDRRSTTWSPVYPSAHARLAQQYVKGADRVDLFVAYFTWQRNGAELINYRNTIADHSSWARAASGFASVRIGSDTQSIERSRILLRGKENRIVYRWYWVGGRFTANPYVAKILQALSLLLPGQEAAASIIVSAVYDDVPKNADLALQDFLKNAHPIAPLLQQVSQSR